MYKAEKNVLNLLGICIALYFFLLSWYVSQFFLWDMYIRVRPRFFDQVGHETMYASSGNKHFFTKSCHRQTYQNYEQSQQKLGTIFVGSVHNPYFQSHFSV